MYITQMAPRFHENYQEEGAQCRRNLILRRFCLIRGINLDRRFVFRQGKQKPL